MATTKQIAEGELRMEQLIKAFDLNTNLLKYLKEGRLYYSYLNAGIWGCIDTIEYHPNYVKLCKDFENEHNAYVYHAIESVCMLEGRRIVFLTMLYVSSDESEWKMERLESNYIAAYAYNITDGFGELGDVFLSSNNGAMVRTR